MRLTLSFIFFAIVSLVEVNGQNENPFLVRIVYTPSPTNSHFEYISNGDYVTLIAYHSLHKKIIDDSITFKIQNRDTLLNYIQSLKWKNLDSVDWRCIDGYWYDIEITDKKDSISVRIACPGSNQLLDLISVCGQTIRDRKTRQKYGLK